MFSMSKCSYPFVAAVAADPGFAVTIELVIFAKVDLPAVRAVKRFIMRIQTLESVPSFVIIFENRLS